MSASNPAAAIHLRHTLYIACLQSSPVLSSQQLEAKRREEDAKAEEELAKAKARRLLMAQVRFNEEASMVFASLKQSAKLWSESP